MQLSVTRCQDKIKFFCWKWCRARSYFARPQFLLTLAGVALLLWIRWNNVQQGVLKFLSRDLAIAVEDPPDLRYDWKEVIGGNGDIFSYSAYLDHRLRPNPCIRVIVLADINQEFFVECSYWTVSNKTTTMEGHVTILPDHHHRPLSSGVILCPIPEFPTANSKRETLSPRRDADNSQDNDLKEKETLLKLNEEGHQEIEADPIMRVTVSTIRDKSNNYSASIPVQHLSTRKQRGQLNVCVKEMHSNFNSVIQLVEFVELQRILGADHFTFYNLSVGPDVNQVLDYYSNEGLADVVPCAAPGAIDRESIYRVTVGILNDCILRSVGEFPLVVVNDLDEYIIPREDDDNLKMVQKMDHYTEYGVQNVFFYKYYEDDNGGGRDSLTNNEDGQKSNLMSPENPGELFLVTQRKTRRVEKPHQHKIRSKYICRPEEVLVAGVHYIYQFVGMTRGVARAIRLDPGIALSHHYRSSCEKEDQAVCDKRPTVVDRFAQRFGDRLTEAVLRQCQAIFPQGCPPQ